MEQAIAIFKDWPVIIQGAIGSAVFWLVLIVGQKMSTSISGKYSKHSKTSRLSYLISIRNKYKAASTTDHGQQTRSVVILLYRCSRHIFKSLMWLAVGLIVNSIAEPFGIIGYVGFLVHLFKANDLVSPIGDIELGNPESIKKKIKEIDEEIKALET